MAYETRSKSRRSFLSDNRGATAVEFAFVAPVLCFALLSTLELGVLGLVTSGLDNAVIGVARTIRTGQASAPTDATSFEGQVCARMSGVMVDCRDRLRISVQRFNRFADANAVANAAPDGSFNKGVAGDIVVVKANYHWPLMTPLVAQAYQRAGVMEIVIGARLAFKNEPFG
jgi:Flp pilus assembly protein TadG